MKLNILAIVVAIHAPSASGTRKESGILDDILGAHGLLRGSGSLLDNGASDSPPPENGDSPPPQSGDDQKQTGHNEGDDPPPDGFPRGSKVVIHGLRSAVALNGHTALVHGYDSQKMRYLVELEDGSPKEIKGSHLTLYGVDQNEVAPPQHSARVDQQTLKQAVESRLSPDSVPAGGLSVGTHAIIHGLKGSVQLNGQEVLVRGFDNQKQRYIVQTSDGTPKEIKLSHLKPVLDSTPPMESQQPQAQVAGSFRVPSPVLPQAPQREESESQGMPPLPEGAKVRIVGLHSAKKLNGQIATVHDIDVKTGRYQVELADGSPKEIKREHLLLPDEEARVEALKNGAVSAADKGKSLGPNNWIVGTSVLISGLHSASELNGKVATVRAFDDQMQRYIVVLPGGGPPKKIRPQNLQLANSLGAGSVPSQVHLNVQPQAQPQVPNVQPQAQPQVVQPQANAQQQAPQPQAQSGVPASQVPPKLAAPALPATPVASGPLKPGTHVSVFGLVSAPELNGQVAVVHSFDEKTGRYVVEFATGGKPKKIKESHLKIIDTPQLSLGSTGAVVTSQVEKPQQRVSVCNAYPYNAPLGAFLLSPDGSSYMELFTGIPYQGCTDVNLPEGSQNSTLEFTIDKYQVAKQSLKPTTALKNPSTQLVLVVYRKNPNTLKAAVLANTVTPRKEVYTLLVFNAYRGTDLFELRANRGGIVQELKLNKAYRLSKEQHLAMTLTNGFHDLNLAFQPKKGRVYAAVCTGVAEGLKGEPRNLGFVVHELGDWTASEEMSDQEKETTTLAPVAALQEDQPQDEPADSKPEKSAAIAVVGKALAPLLTVILLQL